MASLSDFTGGSGASLAREFTAAVSGSAGDPVARTTNTDEE